MTEPRLAAVVVLAAGEGTRMRSASTPKVLHPLCGRSMLGHVVHAARAREPDALVVVVGHAREQVTAHLAELDAAARAVVQEEQLGTGHAVRVALDALADQPLWPTAVAAAALILLVLAVRFAFSYASTALPTLVAALRERNGEAGTGLTRLTAAGVMAWSSTPSVIALVVALSIPSTLEAHGLLLVTALDEDPHHSL